MEISYGVNAVILQIRKGGDSHYMSLKNAHPHYFLGELICNSNIYISELYLCVLQLNYCIY